MSNFPSASAPLPSPSTNDIPRYQWSHHSDNKTPEYPPNLSDEELAYEQYMDQRKVQALEAQQREFGEQNRQGFQDREMDPKWGHDRYMHTTRRRREDLLLRRKEQSCCGGDVDGVDHHQEGWSSQTSGRQQMSDGGMIEEEVGDRPADHQASSSSSSSQQDRQPSPQLRSSIVEQGNTASLHPLLPFPNQHAHPLSEAHHHDPHLEQQRQESITQNRSFTAAYDVSMTDNDNPIPQPSTFPIIDLAEAARRAELACLMRDMGDISL